MLHLRDQDDAHTPALRPPRFTLRTMLALVTALCCLFAVMSAVGLLWSAMLALFLSLIAAHVFGNSVGTRLRDHTSHQLAERKVAGQRAVPVALNLNVAAPRQLTQRTKLKRITALMTICGAFVGAQFGGVALAAVHPQSSVAAVVLGVCSSAVLGGFAGFLASSFLSVIRQALAEAHHATTPQAGQTFIAERH